MVCSSRGLRSAAALHDWPVDREEAPVEGIREAVLVVVEALRARLVDVRREGELGAPLAEKPREERELLAFGEPPPGVAVPGEEALRLLRAPLPRDLDPRARRLRRHDQVVPHPRHPVAGDPAEEEETALLVRDELERVGLSGQETGDELDRHGAGTAARAVLARKRRPRPH